MTGLLPRVVRGGSARRDMQMTQYKLLSTNVGMMDNVGIMISQ